MISRTHRFHGYGSLKFVYRHGATVRGPLFAIKTATNPRRKTYRAAVVVSRKVNKSAVARNRIRRRIYEALRAVEDRINGPHDIVITVFSDAIAQEEYKVISAQLEKQLAQAGVL